MPDYVIPGALQAPAPVNNDPNANPNLPNNAGQAMRFSQKKKTVWLDLPQGNSKVDAGMLSKRDKKKRKMPNLLKTHTRTPEMVSNLEDYAHKMGDKDYNFQVAKDEDQKEINRVKHMHEHSFAENQQHPQPNQ